MTTNTKIWVSLQIVVSQFTDAEWCRKKLEIISLVWCWWYLGQSSRVHDSIDEEMELVSRDGGCDHIWPRVTTYDHIWPRVTTYDQVCEIILKREYRNDAVSEAVHYFVAES